MQNDKIQLAAMGEHFAEQQPMCMAKRIEELEAQGRVMAELLQKARKYVTALGKPDDEVSAVQMTVSRIDALLAGQVPAPAAPEGWQLVPRMPTTEMCDAFKKSDADWEDGWAFDDNGNRHESPVYQWIAMLNASPKPEDK